MEVEALEVLEKIAGSLSWLNCWVFWIMVAKLMED